MTVKPVRAAAVFLLCVSVALVGCGTASTQENATGAGAAAGGVLGAVMGARSSVGAVGGAAFGAVAGFIAGSFVGRLLDDGDRAKQDSASQRTLTDGDVIRWRSDQNKGVHGYSEAAPEASVPAGRKQGQTGGCRSVREVSYIDGREYVEMTEYCRAAGANGWTRKAA